MSECEEFSLPIFIYCPYSDDENDDDENEVGEIECEEFVLLPFEYLPYEEDDQDTICEVKEDDPATPFSLSPMALSDEFEQLVQDVRDDPRQRNEREEEVWVDDNIAETNKEDRESEVVDHSSNPDSGYVCPLPGITHVFQKRDPLSDSLPEMIGAINVDSMKHLEAVSDNFYYLEMASIMDHFEESVDKEDKYHIHRCINERGRPFAECRFSENGMVMRVLVDSGCWKSIMHKSVYDYLIEKFGEQEICMQPTSISLKSHTGQFLKVYGCVKWPVWIKNELGNWNRYKTVNWVVSEDSGAMILGGGFMQTRNGKLSYKSGYTRGKSLIPSTITLYLPKGSEELEDGPFEELPTVGNFRLFPCETIDLLKGESKTILCNVVGETPEDAALLPGTMVDLQEVWGGSDAIEFVSTVTDEMTLSLPVTNPDKKAGMTLDHSMCVGKGYPLDLEREKTVSRLDEVVHVINESYNFPTEEFERCVCELSTDTCLNSSHPSCNSMHQNRFVDEQTSSLFFCDRSGNTGFPFMGVTGSWGPSEPINTFMSRNQGKGMMQLFVRATKLTPDMCENILDRFELRNSVKIVIAAPEREKLTSIEMSAAVQLKNVCDQRGIQIQIGIFKASHQCEKHSPWELPLRSRTIIHFTQSDKKPSGNAFGKSIRMKMLRKIKRPELTLRKTSKDSVNLISCFLENPMVQMDINIARAAIRQVLHAVKLDNPKTILTVLVDKKVSAFNLVNALNSEMQYSKIKIRSFLDNQKRFELDQVTLGEDVKCALAQDDDIINAIKESFCKDEEDDFEVASVVDIRKTIAASETIRLGDDEPVQNRQLPNPETKDGLDQCIELGRHWKPTPSYCEMAEALREDSGKEDFPDMAKETQSVDSERTVPQNGGNLPIYGPKPKHKVWPATWRDLPEEDHPFSEENKADPKCMKFHHWLFDKFDDVIQKGKGHLKTIKCKPLDAKLTKAHHMRKPYGMSKEDQEILHYILKEMEMEEYLEKITTSAYTSPVFLVYRGREQKDMTEEQKREEIRKNPRKFYRVVVDLSGINKLTEHTANEMMSAEQVIDRLQGGVVYSVVDLAELFHNIPLTRRLSNALALIAPGPVIYRPLNGIEGFSDIPMYANQVVQNMLVKSRQHTVSFLDDICVEGSSIEDLRLGMTYLFEDLQASNAMVNLSKMKLERTQFTYLGFVFKVDEGKRLTYIPMTQKFTIFESITITDVASVMRYLGLLAFVSAFVSNLAMLCLPLYAILSEKSKEPKTTTVELSEVQQYCFETLNNKVMNAEALVVPGVNQKIRIYVDAGKYTYGAFLTVIMSGEEKIGKMHSRSFTPAFARSNSSLAKEAYAVMNELNRLKYHVWSAKETVVVSDCRPFVYLATNGSPACAVIPQKWMMVLSAFKGVKYRFIKREKLYGPDILGRYKKPGTNEPMKIVEDVPGMPSNEYKTAKSCQVLNGLLTEGKEYTMAELVEIGQQYENVLYPHSRCSECDECSLIGLPESDPNAHVVECINEGDEESDLMDEEDAGIQLIIDHIQNVRFTFSIVEEIWHEVDSVHDEAQRAFPSDEQLQGKKYNGVVIADAQDKDEFCRMVKLKINTEASLDSKYAKFTLLGSLLMRKKYEKTTETEHMKVVVPDSLMTQMLHTAHQLGHPHHVKLVQMMKRYFYNTKMRKMAHDIVMACGHCLRFKIQTVRNLPMGMLVPALNPFDVLFVDFMHMTPVYHRGKEWKYILTIVDQFSFMVFGFATEDMTSTTFVNIIESIRKGLKMLQLDIGLIVADNQRSLLHSVETQQYLEEQEIDYKNTFPYMSQNNLAEIGNRLIRNVLRSLHKNDESQWPFKLETGVKIINSTPHEYNNKMLYGRTPLEIVTGRAPENSPFEDIDSHPSKVREYLKRLKQLVNDTRFRFNQALINERKETSRVKEGGLVLRKIKDKDRKSKQMAYYQEGYWRVVKLDGHAVFLENNDDPNERVRTHISKVKPVGLIPRDIYKQLDREERAKYAFVGPSEYGLKSRGSISTMSSAERRKIFNEAVQDVSGRGSSEGSSIILPPSLDGEDSTQEEERREESPESSTEFGQLPISKPAKKSLLAKAWKGTKKMIKRSFGARGKLPEVSDSDDTDPEAKSLRMDESKDQNWEGDISDTNSVFGQTIQGSPTPTLHGEEYSGQNESNDVEVHIPDFPDELENPNVEPPELPRAAEISLDLPEGSGASAAVLPEPEELPMRRGRVNAPKDYAKFGRTGNKF